MQETMRVKTSQKFEVVDLTAKVADAVGRSGVIEGLCTVFVRHATAAIVINENADAGFRHDIIAALDKLFTQGVWQHDKVDDNGAAHLKAAVLGPTGIASEGPRTAGGCSSVPGRASPWWSVTGPGRGRSS